MKNGHSPAHVVVVHAYGGSPRKFWYPSLKKHLPVTCLVTVPQLPGGNAPQVSTWLDSLRALLREDSGASVQQRSLFLVGHSLGCNAILRLLAGSETALLRGLRGVLFVAGWLWVDEPWEQIQPWCDPPPDLAAARQALVALGARATLLVSDNDRFTRDHERTRRMFQEGLGAHVVLCPGRAHFGGRKQDAVREELRRLMVDDNECRGGGGSPEQGSAAASAPLASGHGEGQAEGQREQREAEGQAERQRVGVMEEQREGVMRLLDCAVDALNEVLDVLLTDFTAGCASLGRLACTCKHLRQLVRCAQPQIDARAAALGGAELSPLSLEQLAILESVASLCIYPSERCGSGVIATLSLQRARRGCGLDRRWTVWRSLRRCCAGTRGRAVTSTRTLWERACSGARCRPPAPTPWWARSSIVASPRAESTLPLGRRPSRAPQGGRLVVMRLVEPRSTSRWTACSCRSGQITMRTWGRKPRPSGRVQRGASDCL